MEQFELYPLPLPFLPLPNVILFLLIAAAVPLLIAKMAAARPLAGSWWTTLNESLYATILRMVEENVGSKAAVHFPLLFLVFHLVLFGNLIGLAPYTATPTAELVLTLAAAFALLVGALVGGIIAHGPRLLALYLPAGTPLALIPLMVVLELLAFVTRTLSLGLRLGVNLITGHILVKVMAGFVWGFLESGSLIGLFVGFALVAAFVGLEVLICYLQALIFTFITLITLKEMANLKIVLWEASLGAAPFSATRPIGGEVFAAWDEISDQVITGRLAVTVLAAHFPALMLLAIAAAVETNRAPFDLLAVPFLIVGAGLATIALAEVLPLAGFFLALAVLGVGQAGWSALRSAAQMIACSTVSQLDHLGRLASADHHSLALIPAAAAILAVEENAGPKAASQPFAERPLPPRALRQLRQARVAARSVDRRAHAHARGG